MNKQLKIRVSLVHSFFYLILKVEKLKKLAPFSFFPKNENSA